MHNRWHAARPKIEPPRAPQVQQTDKMTTYPAISLRFFPTLDCKAGEDVEVELFRVGESIAWSFKEPSMSSCHQMQFDSFEELEKSLEGMFAILSWDSEPYARVQITAPGYPAVLFRMQDATDEAYYDIAQFIKLVIDNWARRGSRKDLVRASNEIAEAEDDDDSCADMPGLVEPGVFDAAATLNAFRNTNVVYADDTSSDGPAANTRAARRRAAAVERFVEQTPNGVRVHSFFN